MLLKKFRNIQFFHINFGNLSIKYLAMLKILDQSVRNCNIYKYLKNKSKYLKAFHNAVVKKSYTQYQNWYSEIKTFKTFKLKENL